MDEKDFQDLLSEIDSMTVEEYNEFHEEVLKMRYDDVDTYLLETYLNVIDDIYDEVLKEDKKDEYRD